MSYEPSLEVCELCDGTGYTPPKPRKFRRVSGPGFVTGLGTWFCDCSQGQRQEAGYWFRVCYPEDKGGRHPSVGGEQELSEYLSANQFHRRWLPAAIEECRKRYEAERTRKLQTRDESAT